MSTIEPDVMEGGRRMDGNSICEVKTVSGSYLCS